LLDSSATHYTEGIRRRRLLKEGFLQRGKKKKKGEKTVKARWYEDRSSGFVLLPIKRKYADESLTQEGKKNSIRWDEGAGGERSEAG